MKTPREAFEHAIVTWEGLYQGDAADAGNIRRGREVIGTMRGVTPKVWAAYKGIPVESVTVRMMKAISLEDAVDVYAAFYYSGPGFDRLKWCAATEVWCDIGWGSGPAVAIKAMQRMIGVHPDGVIGPQTIERYNEWVETREPAGAVQAIQAWRVDFYKKIAVSRPANKKFLVGWLRRANYYSPTNHVWWSSWVNGEEYPAALYADGVPKAPPVTHEEVAGREVSTQRIVQSATLAGTAATGLASTGIFGSIPSWAIGVAVVVLVGVGAIWALKSFGVIKRSV